MKREIYLETTPLNEATEKWLKRLEAQGFLKPFTGEKVRVMESLGRITAEPAIARLSSPFYHSSAMDGYAVKYQETFGASETSPQKIRLIEQTVYVDTGDPMPDGFNAVIMIEDVNVYGNYIEITEPATPWQNVRVIGEDIVATELILPENHRIRPVDIGAMLTGGYVDINVRRKPKVVIIPTGTEIVEPGTNLKKGDIIEYNSRVLGSLVSEWGGEAVRFRIVPDNLDELKDAILEAHKVGDMVVINAGASSGSEDFTSRVISETGEVILHGVSIKPGKPVIIGVVKNKPILGIPGYPVSAFITFNLFAKPVIYRWQGIEMEPPEVLRASLSRQVASNLGQEEFLRVKIGKVRDKFIATPVSRGAGVLMSLVRADGFVRIPAMSEGIGAGSEVNAELLRTKNEIENTIVCIGSHDNALDLLANSLKKKYLKLSLSSGHVGSIGGLMALKKGEAHIAGTHLLDDKTGEYNVSSVKRLLSDRRIILVNLFYREQGLLILKGNPKNIKGFEDLTREDVVFINRQAGAGTRLLTDKHLRECRIKPEDVKGYEREEYTHMGVASAVLTGIADTGLAILASAKALGLDFIPVAKERYDLAVPFEFYNTDMMKALLSIIREDYEFREMVGKLGGYDVCDMGKVMYDG